MTPRPTFPTQKSKPYPLNPSPSRYRSGLSDKVKRSRSGRALARRNAEVRRQKSGSLIPNPSILTPQSTLPPMTQTLPQNINIPLPQQQGNILESIGGIFNNSQGNILESIGGIFNNSQGNILESIGGIFNNSGGNSIGDYVKNLFGGSGENPTAITVNLSINIEGNADEKVMQKAGQEMSINLEREMQKILGNWQRDKLRSSF